MTGTDNVYYRMVTSYWEMAASFVVRGILSEPTRRRNRVFHASEILARLQRE